MKSLAVLCLGLVTSVNAATIAVIDSGVDYKHDFLKENMWRNTKGLYGWNFAENNAQVFDADLLTTFSPDLKKFNDITSKSYLFSMTEEEKAWAMAQMKVEGYSNELQRFGTYVHGTHVAGIAKNNSSHKIMAVKLLATPVKGTLKAAMEEVKSQDPEVVTETEDDQNNMLAFLFTRLAFENANSMKGITTYTEREGAKVANASFGMGVKQAISYAASSFQMTHKRKPTQVEIIQWALMLLKLTVKAEEASFTAAPNTLFVFAAGNDSLDNDLYPSAPACVKADNTITVAATYQDQFFAPFSNYGVKTVEVAAPGMVINSSIPGNEFMNLSGTSQAAPFVSNVAGKILDANPALRPLEVKQILMGTVDKKEFLKIRVSSGGIVNGARAVLAAELSKELSLEEAIQKANVIIETPKPMKKGKRLPFNVEPVIMPSMFAD